MKEEIRLIIAFTISIIIIIAFGKYSSKNIPSRNIKQQEQITEEKEEKPIEQPVTQKTENLLGELEKIEKKLSVYENQNFILGINEKGGFIDSIGLKKYKRKNEKFFPIIKNNFSFLLFQKGKDDLIEKLWNIKKEENIVSLSTTSRENLYFEKILSIPSNSFTFKTEIKIKNTGKNAEEIDDLIINLFTFDQKKIKEYPNYRYLRFEMYLGNNSGIIKKNITRVKKRETFKDCRFVAFKSGYALILYRTEKPMDVFISKDDGIFTSGFILKNISLKGSEEKTLKFNFYAGPYDYFVASREVKENIFGKGFFVSMGRFLFAALYNIHRFIPNWGWAIILLTLIIKILFFPLTRNSLKSMKQLQKLRPYLQDLQKKYKDDPQKMQKEMFNLYREYKINPFGGCIPMLIQFPIFIGFFIALRNSIFLRGAPFILWIQDLSMPDTVFKIGNFPVNILPLLMTLTSFWQQKLTPTEPSQKGLTLMMPLMFLFIFYNFSSGLLLYWITMNIGGLIEQYFIHKK